MHRVTISFSVFALLDRLRAKGLRRPIFVLVAAGCLAGQSGRGNAQTVAASGALLPLLRQGATLFDLYAADAGDGVQELLFRRVRALSDHDIRSYGRY